MKQQKYFVVVFGNGTDETGDVCKLAGGFGGELEVFKTKTELTTWCNRYMVRPHDTDFLAGQCILQLLDGRACMIIRGTAKALKQRVQVL